MKVKNPKAPAGTREAEEDWHQRGRLKKALFVLLFALSPAFADDQNVYDFNRQITQNSDSAIVDDQLTAVIKRHMANLLYPVDMASFTRPEKDAKFREQIITLQKQMGEPATGTLTIDQFNRLAGAARDIDGRPIGTWPGKLVDQTKNGDVVWAVGTGGTDDAANPLAHPINISRIYCQRSTGTRELSSAEFSPEDSQLYFATPFIYSVTNWGPARITATIEEPCGTALLSIDMQTKSVVVSSVPHSDLPFCAKEGPSTWRLLDDGFPVIWKLHQNKFNKARALVFDPEKRLVPPASDVSAR